jgi:predicted amidophosphoribosyltransferase
MACPQCHSAVRVGSKFCGECGTPMAKHCTNCNADLSATSKFCGECGTPVSPPPA